MRGPSARGYLTVALGVLVLLAAISIGLHAQEPGFFSGLVVDNLSSRPLDGAIVTIVALEKEAETSDNGQFLFEGITPGMVEVRFEADGYVGVVEQMELTASDFIQVRLDPLAAVLDELLIVAGRRARTASDLPVALGDQPGKTALDLLAEFPGLSVSQGGGMATGGFVFIRGVNSFTGEIQTPVIYLDGIQIDNRQTGRQTNHNLTQIPAESVSRIRVLKGPDAFTYPMGANGVILIETHRGGERSAN